jgi:hypothetical protein
MDVTKPYKFIWFGAMDVTKPYEFIGFGAMDAYTGPKLQTRVYQGPGYTRGAGLLGPLGGSRPPRGLPDRRVGWIAGFAFMPYRLRQFRAKKTKNTEAPRSASVFSSTIA